MINDKCMIVRIPLSLTDRRDNNGRPSVYEAANHCWRANIDRASKAHYVLAVDKGKIVGVFEPECWHPIRAEQCEEYRKTMEGPNMRKCEKRPRPCGRIAFAGGEADDKIQERYFHKSLAEIFPDVIMGQNPVCYTF